MNKKILSLVIAACVTTAVPAETVKAPTGAPLFSLAQVPGTPLCVFTNNPATHFACSEEIKAKSSLYAANPTFLAAEIGFKERQLKIDEAQARLEQQIQTGFFVAAGAAATLFVGCLFAEWLQEYNVKKAEKAKIIAEINSKTLQIKASCR